jgi:hypothetical protein
VIEVRPRKTFVSFASARDAGLVRIRLRLRLRVRVRLRVRLRNRNRFGARNPNPDPDPKPDPNPNPNLDGCRIVVGATRAARPLSPSGL